MRYSGFGSVDVTDAVAVPRALKSSAPPRPQRLQPKTDRSDSQHRRSHSIKAAERAVRDAQAAVSEAERTAEERDRSRQDLRQEQAHRRDLVADLEQQLRVLRHARDQAGVGLRNAEREFAAAERELRVARQRAAKAAAALDEALSANT
jgi:chromosome segregation ATPase